MRETSGSYGEYSVDDEDQISGEDALDDDVSEGRLSDELDRGIISADHYSTDYGNTAWEEEHRETIDQRLRQEQPETATDQEWDDAEESDDPDGREVGSARAGRLVDEGGDLHGYCRDAGVDGAGASAEEAAMHVIDEDIDENG